MRSLAVLLIFLIFTSCSPVSYNSAAGKYQTKGGFEWGSNLVLGIDSTFTYRDYVGGYTGGNTGTWKPAGKKIILNSYLQHNQDTTEEYYIIKSYNDNSQKITFDVTDGIETMPGANGLLFQNGNIIESKWSDVDGRIIFTNHIADSITIFFIGFKKVVLTGKITNYCNVKMVQDNYANAIIFTNETMKVRGNKLIGRSKHTFYFDKRFYKIE